MATLELRRLNKTHDDGSCAVDDLDLRVGDGELFVLVGPSGCGKTTVLRAVAGLEQLTHGDVLIGNTTVTHESPQTRDVAMVFQSNVLYPHMTVRDNIGFSLRLAKERKSEVRRRVDDVAGMLHLTDVLDRHPGQLSGGQQQRAAIGRAIIRRPQLLLMDEPLSSLDAHLRAELRSHIVALQHRLGVTTLYVTHDQVEAMAMGDRAAIMRDGHIVQEGTPLELYQFPADLFVAQFIGTPMMNVVLATVARRAGVPVLRLGAQMLELDEIACARLPGVHDLVGRRVALGIRPEAIRHHPDGQITVSATGVEQHGPDRLVHATIGAGRVVQTDDRIVVDDDPTSTIAITVDTTDEIDIFRPFKVTIDTTRIHLFDLSTGRALARHQRPG
jgi:multiple sugar transport system ATP-binding protein